MNCLNCNFQNRDIAKICANCGQKLTEACRKCGTHLQAGVRFCDQCGATLDEGAQTERQAAPKWHHQLMRTWLQSELLQKNSRNLFQETVDKVSVLLIQEALRACGGKRSQAADLLGLSRTNLHSKLVKYSIS
jgi:DNA-binding NtrC family response regulator